MSDSDSLAKAANRLSLLAVVLSGSAFVIAFLQVLLQYVTASEERFKCNSSAIDISEKRWSFSFLHWKTKFYYPELDLSLERIKSQRKSDIEKYHLQNSPVFLEFKNRKGYCIKPLDPSKVPKREDIQDGTNALVRKITQEDDSQEDDSQEDDSQEDDSQEVNVTTKELPWVLYLKWCYWIYSNPPPPMRRSRATWAQLLRTFSLRNTKQLCTRFVDASVIPRDLDVPIQRIGLFELGKMAMFLGFTEVEIKIKERQFTATGPFAAITTVELEYFGKVLRFEGDPFVIAYKLPQSNTYFDDRAPENFTGELSIGNYNTRRSVVPLEVYLQNLKEVAAPKDCIKAEDDWMENHATKGDTRENLYEEASCFQNIWIKILRSSNLPNQEGSQGRLKVAIRSWQERNRLTIPTILALSCFAGIPSAVNGFPSNLFIHPFMDIARVIAKEITHSESKSFKESELLQTKLTHRKLRYMDELSTMFMSLDDRGLAKDGSVSWGFSPLWQIFDALPCDLQDEILGLEVDGARPEQCDWTFDEVLTGSMIRADKINVLIMPEALAMLTEFQPREWLAEMSLDRDLSTVVMSWTPQAVIWCQLTIIDLSIYLLIIGCYCDTEEDFNRNRQREEKWDCNELKILTSIIESWKLEEGEANFEKQDTPYLWDLFSALKKNSDIPQREGVEKRLRKLSDALTLRCLFYIAFLMINPDTSDLFLARKSKVEMPMI